MIRFVGIGLVADDEIALLQEWVVLLEAAVAVVDRRSGNSWSHDHSFGLAVTHQTRRSAAARDSVSSAARNAAVVAQQGCDADGSLQRVR